MKKRTKIIIAVCSAVVVLLVGGLGFAGNYFFDYALVRAEDGSVGGSDRDVANVTDVPEDQKAEQLNREMAGARTEDVYKRQVQGGTVRRDVGALGVVIGADHRVADIVHLVGIHLYFAASDGGVGNARIGHIDNNALLLFAVGAHFDYLQYPPEKVDIPAVEGKKMCIRDSP